MSRMESFESLLSNIDGTISYFTGSLAYKLYLLVTILGYAQFGKPIRFLGQTLVPRANLANQDEGREKSVNVNNRLPHRDHRASYSGESSTIPKHKISISSSSNFTSPDSPQSEEYHSRLSSVASVSGISSMSIPIVEIPSIDAKLLEARNFPSSYGIASQPPSPPLTEKSSIAVQSRTRIMKQFLDDSSAAILNWNNLDKPGLFGQDSRYVFQIFLFSHLGY